MRDGDGVRPAAAPAPPGDPAPGTRFPGGIVVFDGQCGFCVGSVRFILARDRAARFGFAARQSAAGQRLLAAHGLGPEGERTLMLFERDRVHLRTDAALRIAHGLGGVWRVISHLRLVPRPLRDACYRVFAASRHRLFGRTESCMAPRPEERARFLE